MTSACTCITLQLEHQPFECQDCIPAWRVAWTNIHASTIRFCKTCERTFILQIEEGCVWLQTISSNVVSKNWYIFKDQVSIKSDHDHNMCYKIKNGNILFLFLYVDDLLLTWNLDEEIQQLKEQPLATFEMMDLGKVLFCLGIKFVYLSSFIFLT
jgi:hypothetical protein